ncbi:DUF1294 domain-containing protein [Photobacterium phosphoreum]|uniref:DUF1294 domain-containing protein n=1 Tax=Photobacterium phosphoreum TaxID=659 RepID=UPI000D151E81|nr:cold shock and DUF1294 domain-containing protein [Photobacterium phosphoreum]PSW32298.1 DUF1294 domain-containing protein [Photobacterium phosphoreum]
MNNKGTIVQWNHQKGFGFIQPQRGGDNVFFHISALVDRQSRPRINESVYYELSTDNKGKKSAKSIIFVKPHSGMDKYTAPMSKAQGFSVLFLALVAGWVWLARCPYWVLIGYICLSIVTFAVYAHDKRAAQKDRWRTKEASLHLLALAGGWPGALWAQKILRHKSQKQPFKAILWLMIIANITVFIMIFTPFGYHWLHNATAYVSHFF